MSNEKKIYVIGHKNPDTDSVVSAIAYADLKNEMGITNCFPARAGKLNQQTEYILDRFGINPPEFISELVPKVKNYMSYDPVTSPHSLPLWHSLELLIKKNFKMLPIVDDENRYMSTLHYNAFAHNMMKKIDPMKKRIIATSVHHLIITVNAAPVVVFNENEIFESLLYIAAHELDTFRKHLKPLETESLIVTVGDREDIQRYVIEKKVRVLIVTGGIRVRPEIISLAEKNGVTLLISPFDTSMTTVLIFFSTPVKYMGDETVRPVKEDEYLDSIREYFIDSVSKSLPVVDDDNRVIGVIAQSDLIRETNIELILVDHNELSQSVDGAEYCKILEIIDHHRLGNLHTTNPITFINKPVGSTSTIVASQFQNYKIPMKKEIASLLLAGILSDTIILRSATTTDADRKIAENLSRIAGLNMTEFGNEIMAVSSLIAKRPVEEILAQDMKSFTEGKYSFTVSQVEVHSLIDIMERKKELFEGLYSLHKSGGTFFSSLMITDITELDSVLLIQGDKMLISRIGYHKIGDNLFMLKGIISRKKQLMPILIELVKKFK